MSCRWQFSLPHPDDVCLDCECLAPDKCVEHGPHEGHDVQMVKRGKFSEYRCLMCGMWLRDA